MHALTAGVVIHATLKVRPVGCSVAELAGDTSLVQLSGERGWDLFVLQAPDPSVAKAELAAWRETFGIQPEIVADTGATILFRGANKADGTVATIRHGGCTILWPTIARDGFETYNIIAPSRATLRDLVTVLSARWPTTVERLVEVPGAALTASVPVADLAADLTPRQLEVLTTALGEGYYDAPRRATLEDLSAALGISHSTVSEHLRKAERAVLNRVATLFAQYPALPDAAMNGPGRPRTRL